MLARTPDFNVARAYAPVSLDFAFRVGIVDGLGPEPFQKTQGRIAHTIREICCLWWQTGGFQMAANPVSPNSELVLSTERKDTEAVVHASGRITAATSAQLQSTIRALFPDSKHVVLDLKGVHYIDSSGIGALVSVHMAAGKAQSVLELTNLQPRIRDLFELTRLTTVFENHGGYRGLTPD